MREVNVELRVAQDGEEMTQFFSDFEICVCFLLDFSVSCHPEMASIYHELKV